MGDVAGILDSAGSLVVEYRYDAWGRATYASDQLPISNWLCLLNPFRYRGYIYDSETGMYYLRSRYYNPEIGRFLNADENLGNCGGVFSHNTYAYGANAPTCTIDSDGMAFMFITAAIGAAVGAVVGGCVALVNGDNVLVGAGIGAVAGGLVGLGAGAVAATVLTGSAVASTSAVCASFSLLYDKVANWAETTFNCVNAKVGSWLDTLSLKLRGWRAGQMIERYTQTKTVAAHTDRLYKDSFLVIREIIRAATPTHDASGKNVLKWVVHGTMQLAEKASQGTWELVLNDKTKQILHILFNSKSK